MSSGADPCLGGRLRRVADRDGAARRSLVGRAGEIDALNSLLRAAAHGERVP
jgi:hypothetical protein